MLIFLDIAGSIVIALAPLISLMIDQKYKFIKKGILVEFVGQAQEDTAAMSAVVNGDIQLVYISSENLLCYSKGATVGQVQEESTCPGG